MIKYLIGLLLIAPVFLTQAKECDLIKLHKSYIGEQETGGVVYLAPKEREQFEIKVDEQGRIMSPKGDLLDTSEFDGGKAIFVYSKEGKIYISTLKRTDKFNQSSLVGGEDVIVAGTIYVFNGVLSVISDFSGAYEATDKGNLKAAIYKLKVLGVDTSKLKAFFSN